MNRNIPISSESNDAELVNEHLKKLKSEKLTLENLLNDPDYIMSVDEMIRLKEKSAKIAKLKINLSSNIKNSITNVIEDKEIGSISNDEAILSNLPLSKEKYISFLKQVKIDHIKWVRHVHLLTEHGILSKEKDNIQENYTLCEFGKWYYDQGQTLLYFNEFKNIEPLHIQLHKCYSNIYRVFSKNKKINWFGKNNNINFEKARNELFILDGYSYEIIKNINILIEILHSLSHKEFETFSKQG